MTLVVVASLVGFLAIFSVWVSRQLLETQTWSDTSTELLEKENIRGPVAGFLVDSLFKDEDVQQVIANALPKEASGLAGPATGAFRQLGLKAADDALGRLLSRRERLIRSRSEASAVGRSSRPSCSGQRPVYSVPT